MYRFSNTVIGFLNLFTLLASIPIIGAGLWMARSSTTCESFLQTPLLVVGFVILIISLAGFIGACFHVAWALWVYLVIMLFLIGTDGSDDFRVHRYGGWRGGGCAWEDVQGACSKVVLWTPFDYLTKDMTPIQSGCCKPPTSCNYAAATLAQEADCYRWNNAPPVLCYDCDSCKAGVLEDVRRDWHKLSVLNIVMVIVLIGIYSIGCCAFQNAKRAETDYPYGHNRMYKVRPRWDFHW
ncbi:UNVERIFIED_CONTAM: Tetraspanin-6 [Sesamum calycinum]|uniref:Tetraspanin-6 n=1 Tax=Sesamum calycinum TaxID=2727403 RepID=A0AAW2LT83_9LAMI